MLMRIADRDDEPVRTNVAAEEMPSLVAVAGQMRPLPPLPPLQPKFVVVAVDDECEMMRRRTSWATIVNDYSYLKLLMS